MSFLLLLLFLLCDIPVASGQSVSGSWIDQSDNEEAFYMERQANGASFFGVAVLPANTQQWVDTQVLFDVPYCYRIRAGNQCCSPAPCTPVPCYSNYSNTACITLTAAVPDAQLFLSCMQTEIANPILIAAINFQPPSSPVPSGYLKDDGSIYSAARGYGWDQDVSGNTRDREINSDQRLDTFVFVWGGATAIWSYTLPNGSYLISLASGDPGYDQGPHYVEAEGVVLVNNTPTTANAYITVTDVPVNVSDGQLTITIGSTSAGNTMLCYLIIEQQ